MKLTSPPTHPFPTEVACMTENVSKLLMQLKTKLSQATSTSAALAEEKQRLAEKQTKLEKFGSERAAQEITLGGRLRMLVVQVEEALAAGKENKEENEQELEAAEQEREGLMEECAKQKAEMEKLYAITGEALFEAGQHLGYSWHLILQCRLSAYALSTHCPAMTLDMSGGTRAPERGARGCATAAQSSDGRGAPTPSLSGEQAPFSDRMLTCKSLAIVCTGRVGCQDSTHPAGAEREDSC
eukprot:1574451-Rhodomonas_salina.1